MKHFIIALMSVLAASFLVGFSFLDEAGTLGIGLPIAISTCILLAMMSIHNLIYTWAMSSPAPDFWSILLAKKSRANRNVHSIGPRHPRHGKAAA
jgi:hypothetical protein